MQDSPDTIDKETESQPSEDRMKKLSSIKEKAEDGKVTPIEEGSDEL